MYRHKYRHKSAEIVLFDEIFLESYEDPVREKVVMNLNVDESDYDG